LAQSIIEYGIEFNCMVRWDGSLRPD